MLVWQREENPEKRLAQLLSKTQRRMKLNVIFYILIFRFYWILGSLCSVCFVFDFPDLSSLSQPSIHLHYIALLPVFYIGYNFNAICSPSRKESMELHHICWWSFQVLLMVTSCHELLFKEIIYSSSDGVSGWRKFMG